MLIEPCRTVAWLCSCVVGSASREQNQSPHSPPQGRHIVRSRARGHQSGAAGLRSRGRHRLSGGREPSSGHAAWSGAGTCASSHGPLPRTPPLRRHPERTHETSRRRCHLEGRRSWRGRPLGFLDALDAESPVRQVLTGPLIKFISSERTVVHARNTGGVLSGQRAAIRSRLSGLAASAPGRTARGSPGRH